MIMCMLWYGIYVEYSAVIDVKNVCKDEAE